MVIRCSLPFAGDSSGAYNCDNLSAPGLFHAERIRIGDSANVWAQMLMAPSDGQEVGTDQECCTVRSSA
jgi:hypothetical protein